MGTRYCPMVDDLVLSASCTECREEGIPLLCEHFFLLVSCANGYAPEKRYVYRKLDRLLERRLPNVVLLTEDEDPLCSMLKEFAADRGCVFMSYPKLRFSGEPDAEKTASFIQEYIKKQEKKSCLIFKQSTGDRALHEALAGENAITKRVITGRRKNHDGENKGRKAGV